jgi:hypothetical protein
MLESVNHVLAYLSAMSPVYTPAEKMFVKPAVIVLSGAKSGASLTQRVDLKGIF